MTTENEMLDDVIQECKVGADHISIAAAVFRATRKTIAPVEMPAGWVAMPGEITKPMEEAWAAGGVTMAACYRAMAKARPAMPNPVNPYEPKPEGALIPVEVLLAIAADITPGEKMTPDRAHAYQLLRDVARKHLEA